MIKKKRNATGKRRFAKPGIHRCCKGGFVPHMKTGRQQQRSQELPARILRPSYIYYVYYTIVYYDISRYIVVYNIIYSSKL